MDLDLSGKHAMVCGSSQGIGKACAKELAGLGANVTLVARSETMLHQVHAELDLSHGQIHKWLVADFSRPSELREALEDHMEECDWHYNILVNNTGGPPAGPASSADEEEFRAAFNQHLICNQILVRHLAPGMSESGYGRIINIISTSVKQPLPNLGVSNTIRGAVANWAKTLANELGPHNITVNNVLPGATQTHRLKQIISKKAASSETEEEKVALQMQAAVPLKRFAAPAEIANAVAFLASPAASYVNGINLPVDGGRTACL